MPAGRSTACFSCWTRARAARTLCCTAVRSVRCHSTWTSPPAATARARTTCVVWAAKAATACACAWSICRAWKWPASALTRSRPCAPVSAASTSLSTAAALSAATSWHGCPWSSTTAASASGSRHRGAGTRAREHSAGRARARRSRLACAVCARAKTSACALIGTRPVCVGMGEGGRQSRVVTGRAAQVRASPKAVMCARERVCS
mmetsp:Transcript_36997/g.109049  ORF Transcript_36997/g.109049 Transcript_36997/m.109049 type:complete len:205 (-) Transcript_36997:290-904(-)